MLTFSRVLPITFPSILPSQVPSPKLSLVHPYLLLALITLDRVDNMGKHQDTTQHKISTRVDDESHHNCVASSRAITRLETTNVEMGDHGGFAENILLVVEI